MSARAALLLLAAASGTAQAQATEGAFYLGLRGGGSWTARDDGDYLRALNERGHQVQIIAVDAADRGGTAYAGWRFHPNASVELGYVLLGQFDSAVYSPRSDLETLARDVAEQQPDSGDAVSLSMRWEVPLYRRLQLQMRFGGFWWWQDVDLQVNGASIDADRDNIGFMVGGGLALPVYGGWWIGGGGDLYRTSSREPVRQAYLQLEYRFD